ncbi:MAG: aminomethyl-transferring glycine dehydrogenase [Actinomycetota bacterium]
MFVDRHLGPTPEDERTMAQSVGYADAQSLLMAAMPPAIVANSQLGIPEPISEDEVISELRRLAALNPAVTSMFGLGYYGTYTPAVLRRNVWENPGWYTAYTPYQPEISQGRLEALFTFQTMITDLTGMAFAGASMLDEATAAAEAIAIMRRVSSTPRDAILVIDRDVFPQTQAVIRTRSEPQNQDVVVADLASTKDPDKALAEAIGDRPLLGIILQYPGASGQVADLRAVIAAAHVRGGLATVAADLLALTLLTPPSEMGADITVGTTQRFGVPMGLGGPHAGYLAVKAGLERSLPGRLVGISVDAAGESAYRLALQTREQHIRRERATSNICTAQVLPALMTAFYAMYHGPKGLKKIAQRVHQNALVLRDSLIAAGIPILHYNFFDTVVLCVESADEVVSAALEQGINLRWVSAHQVAVSCDETTTVDHLRSVLKVFGVKSGVFNFGGKDDAVPASLRRASSYLTHQVFGNYQTETAMVRYLRRLADSDYALDRGMIPLGSCTMKLNAATEMAAVSWPQFANLHPFAPADQWTGLRDIIGDLERWLVEITGYDAVSLQPNAGSQGELAGLLAIREYHRSLREGHRKVCLIPASAHGTNAASAVMAGMRVVVVGIADDGGVDMADLSVKVKTHAADLAAIMVTYPSTHGVFEEHITDVCALVHEAGGQVYVDGANLNALVGWSRPGDFGADVSHLNLHKTFCIPHGGGGPGVGPVAVKSHLAPFLPTEALRHFLNLPDFSASNNKNDQVPQQKSCGPISAAPYGSASILPISWAYIRLMGSSGLASATKTAVMSANYIAVRLRDSYPVLYTGRHGLVAHECVLDLRGITRQTGVTVEDVAKRLIDYGFHAPTMSFPVSGTLMIEPTESEGKAELDRFCDAMIAIRREIQQIEQGEWTLGDSPLRQAPHTASQLVGSWPHPYDRQLAVYPVGVDSRHKYWPPVRRVNAVHGDRNLVCSCPSPEELAVPLVHEQ